MTDDSGTGIGPAPDQLDGLDAPTGPDSVPAPGPVPGTSAGCDPAAVRAGIVNAPARSHFSEFFVVSRSAVLFPLSLVVTIVKPLISTVASPKQLLLFWSRGDQAEVTALRTPTAPGAAVNSHGARSTGRSRAHCCRRGPLWMQPEPTTALRGPDSRRQCGTFGPGLGMLAFCCCRAQDQRRSPTFRGVQAPKKRVEETNACDIVKSTWFVEPQHCMHSLVCQQNLPRTMKWHVLLNLSGHGAKDYCGPPKENSETVHAGAHCERRDDIVEKYHDDPDFWDKDGNFNWNKASWHFMFVAKYQQSRQAIITESSLKSTSPKF